MKSAISNQLSIGGLSLGMSEGNMTAERGTPQHRTTQSLIFYDGDYLNKVLVRLNENSHTACNVEGTSLQVNGKEIASEEIGYSQVLRHLGEPSEKMETSNQGDEFWLYTELNLEIYVPRDEPWQFTLTTNPKIPDLSIPIELYEEWVYNLERGILDWIPNPKVGVRMKDGSLVAFEDSPFGEPWKKYLEQNPEPKIVVF